MSYFVHNPYFFANITSQSFESTTFGRFFIYNHVCSSAFGFLFLPLVFYMILFKSTSSLRHIRKILLIIHLFDLFTLTIYTFGQMRTHYVNDIGLHSFVGILSLLPFEVQMVGNVAYITAVITTFVILPLPLLYRDQMLRRGPPPNSSLFSYLVVVLLFMFISILLFTCTTIKADRSIDYGPFWSIETPIPPLIVIDTQHSLIAFISLTYERVVTAAGFLVSVFIALRSYRFLRSQNDDVGRSRSMVQFERLICAQMMIPTFGLFLPLIGTLIFINIGNMNELAQNFMVIVVVWTPFINSLTTLIFIAPYRQAIVFKVKQSMGISYRSPTVHALSTSPVNNVE